jgi:8-oxo-dGTP pyrophosphatase MutT (NUDIX family)
MGGAIREMHEAYEYKKPIFLVLEGDLPRANSHILSMVLDRGRIFQNFDELFTYLKSEVAHNPSFKRQHIDLFQVSQKLFIKNDRNELLILKSAHGWFYDVPGGRMDYQEFETPFLISLKREVEEELGRQVILDIHESPVALARVQLWDKQLNQYHYRRVFMVFYEADYQGGEIVLSEEHTCMQWVPIAEFNPKGLFKPGMEQAVFSYLERKRAAHLS